MNPANQWGYEISWSSSLALGTSVILGKYSLNTSERPKFKDALILTILFNPSLVKCSFFIH